MNMSEYFKLPDFNPDLLDMTMVKSYAGKFNETGIYLISAKHPSTVFNILKNLNFIDLLKPIIPPLVT